MEWERRGDRTVGITMVGPPDYLGVVPRAPSAGADNEGAAVIMEMSTGVREPASSTPGVTTSLHLAPHRVYSVVFSEAAATLSAAVPVTATDTSVSVVLVIRPVGCVGVGTVVDRGKVIGTVADRTHVFLGGGDIMVVAGEPRRVAIRLARSVRHMVISRRSPVEAASGSTNGILRDSSAHSQALSRATAMFSPRHF